MPCISPLPQVTTHLFIPHVGPCSLDQVNAFLKMNTVAEQPQTTHEWGNSSASAHSPGMDGKQGMPEEKQPTVPRRSQRTHLQQQGQRLLNKEQSKTARLSEIKNLLGSGLALGRFSKCLKEMGETSRWRGFAFVQNLSLLMSSSALATVAQFCWGMGSLYRYIGPGNRVRPTYGFFFDTAKNTPMITDMWKRCDQ